MDFIKIFDISGDQKMLKQIITLGEGLIKPFEDNYININLKIFIENKIFIEKEKSCFLNKDISLEHLGTRGHSSFSLLSNTRSKVKLFEFVFS